MLRIITDTKKQIEEIEIDNIRTQDPRELPADLGTVLVVSAKGRDLLEILDQIEGIPRPKQGVLIAMGEEHMAIWRTPFAQFIIDNLTFGVDLED